MVDRYCEKCQYLGDVYGMPCCNYIEITGHSRGCPSGTGCDKRVLGNKRATLSFATYFRNEEKVQPAKKTERRNLTAMDKDERLALARERQQQKAARNKARLAGRQRDALMAYKKEHGISIRVMAQRIGMNESTLCKWFNEYSRADWDRLERIGIQKPVELPSRNK